MRVLCTFLMILCFAIGYTQDNEKIAVQQTIERFFEGFHKQDSSVIKSVVFNEIVMQRIAKNKDGKTVLRTQEFSKFLEGIIGIPKTTKFEEKILGYTIQIDDVMANVWTPYEFWLKDSFHHCGVNNFQLLKDDGVWKIIYLVDTGREDNCAK